MIRRAATYVFAASLALATWSALACTGLSLKAQDGAAVRGRTLEFGYTLKSNLVVIPAGKEFNAALPGDFTPPSRFVRAAMFSQNATPNKTAEDAVFATFHILNQFDLPKGSIVYDNPSLPPEVTQWTSANDLENLRYYVRTRQDQALRMVDLKEALKVSKGAVSVINVQDSQQQVLNISAEVRPAEAN